MTDREKNILNRLEACIVEEELSNDFLVQIIELAASYLNLKTIPNYAKDKNLSYNGVKKTRFIKEIIGVKFVIDND